MRVVCIEDSKRGCCQRKMVKCFHERSQRFETIDRRVGSQRHIQPGPFQDDRVRHTLPGRYVLHLLDVIAFAGPQASHRPERKSVVRVPWPDASSPERSIGCSAGAHASWRRGRLRHRQLLTKEGNQLDVGLRWLTRPTWLATWAFSHSLWVSVIEMLIFGISLHPIRTYLAPKWVLIGSIMHHIGDLLKHPGGRMNPFEGRPIQERQPTLPSNQGCWVGAAVRRLYLAMDDAMFGVSGLTMTSLVFGTTTRSMSSIGIAPRMGVSPMTRAPLKPIRFL